MLRNSDSATFLEYLHNTVRNLIQPLEQVQWSIRNNGYPLPSAFETIGRSFQAIGYYFAQLDGKISEEEVAFTEDVLAFLGKNDLGMLPNNQLVNYANQIVQLNPLAFQELYMPPAVEYLQLYDSQYGTGFATQARAMFLKFANAVTKTDRAITPTEQESLERFQKLLFNNSKLPAEIYGLNSELNNSDTRTSNQQNDLSNTTVINKEVTKSGNPTDTNSKNKPDFVRVPEVKKETELSLEEIMAKLDSLIGLEKVKAEVKQLIDLLKVQKLRAKSGLPAYTTSKHLVFSGNPGTGKTTVARLLANIYKSLGVVSQGQFIETDRAGLVAGYIGQTAIQVQEVIKTAIGGVFFIDEAYSLTSNEHGWDYGHEVIDTLVKMMEDNRDNLIVIVAGYTAKMQQFLDFNPGLRSRFNKFIEFDDYTPEQLVQIFQKLCKDASYQTDEKATEVLINLFTTLYEQRDETFGNARLARNLFEHTVNKHSSRIAKTAKIDLNELTTIRKADIPSVEELPGIK